MLKPDVTSSSHMGTPHKGRWTTLAVAAVTGAGALAFALPVAYADPPPPPAPSTTAQAPAPPSGDPNAPPPPGEPNPPPPGDPNPPPPGDSNPPPPGDSNPPPAEPVRVDDPVGGFSYLLPAGWTVAAAPNLSYGSTLLTKVPPPGAVEPPRDTDILMGRLDGRLYAGAEPDNTAAATRLAADMGQFFMPYPGTRINQETVPLDANGVPGAASYYEVKFIDSNRPDGQIWAAAIGSGQQRWFVVWVGNTNNPVDKVAAKNLAQSFQPFTPPPGAPGAPQFPAAVGAAPGPVAPAPQPEGGPPPSPVPGVPAVAPGVAPAPALASPAAVSRPA